MPTEFAAKVFALVDATDAAGFSRLFTPQGRMRFGNNEPMVGPEEIAAGVGGFFGTVKGPRHTVVREWYAGADAVIEELVDYYRLDGETVTIPAATLWHVDETGLIDDFRVYFDLAPLFS
ncbi:nuclear transport factor 2 family protein [Streptomyces sp. NBC_01275]|uniref:nuclear transport factor 2 family protein n=1 Tax=Streptomyces sp. NBC_01275 TaxID=2903807 RepID=UPI00225557CC|nr:nuclear transport factor 2 family protein [Streptomyces sp. NBC_01275]MCX4767302.1 nuclear transport factor 2 family protein [Streptomyces sp. NBC_01275]